ncbi:hypothetical protein B7Y94_04085 [Candidatus Saccharibacteria bacterium 32-49-12]|nr:MAG: hypothetical protein B7Y94_04085 [Candidatus Saccharibacteria bacterium 32-49-12]
MKITGISVQARDKNRVNIAVDGKYLFSLDVFQVGELGLKVGNEYTQEELDSFEQESQFGKLYARSLEYASVRPRSIKEMRDYLWRKTLTTRRRIPKTGQIVEKAGVSEVVTRRVLERLISKGYLDDEKFAKFWIDNRMMNKGASLKRLKLELLQKGVDRDTMERVALETQRSDRSELDKIIAKKRSRYPDRQKLIQYLMRQGFGYDDVVEAVDREQAS